MELSSISTTVLLVASLLAQTVKASDSDTYLPQCAAECIALAIPVSGCDVTDTACLCTSTALNEKSAICISANCTNVEALAAQDYSQKSCGIPERDDSHTTMKSSWTLFSFGVTAILARMICRWYYGGYGLDDWTMLLVLAILIPDQIILSIMLSIGLGRDIWTVSAHNITKILHYFWISEYTYDFIMCLEKISILFMYLRIWPDLGVSNDTTRFRRLCYVLLGILATTAPTMAMVITFQCDPISYAWNRWKDSDGIQTNGVCIDSSAFIYASAGLNITYDICVYCLPIPRLMALNMTPRKKFAVGFLFLCSLFATMCSIVRLAFLVRFGNTTNFTWDYNKPARWSAVECHVTAVCACLPALGWGLARMWRMGARKVGKIRSAGSGSGNEGGSGGGAVRCPPKVVKRRQQWDDEDDDLDGEIELTRLRETPGSFEDIRADSVFAMAKDGSSSIKPGR